MIPSKLHGTCSSNERHFFVLDSSSRVPPVFLYPYLSCSSSSTRARHANGRFNGSLLKNKNKNWQLLTRGHVIIFYRHSASVNYYGAYRLRSSSQLCTTAVAPALLPVMKTCHYEILKVAQDCSDSELKKAYRAAALQYHPDKNRGREDEAEEEFKLVQEAYDILSDAHERSWYDSHREQILRGQTPGENDAGDSTAAATEVDLFSFFTNSCFEKYDDNENGFYTVYRQLFLALANEENRSFIEFGYSHTTWDVVKSFYAEWEGFNSGKIFGFAEKWNLAEAHDRHERRAMERQNKSARTKAKKDYNASIRELVGFVKKRDPRVKKQKKIDEAARVAKNEERRIKEEADKLKKKERLAQAKLARNEAMEEDAAALDEILASIQLDDKKERRKAKKKMENRNVEDHEDDVEDNSEEEFEEEEEEIGEDYYCIACKKKFRTQAQSDNHNASKKHAQAVTRMKKQMKEDAMFFDTRDSEDIWIDTGETDQVTEEAGGSEQVESKTAKKKRKKKEAKMKQLQAAMAEEESNDYSEVEEEVEIPTKTSKKKKKLSAKMKQMQATLSEESDNDEKRDNDDAELFGNGKKSKKGNVQAGLEGDIQKKPMTKKEKRKERERKKAAGEVNHNCNVCEDSFPSKTKLMKHVEKEGHARAVPVEGGGKNRRKR